MRRNILKIRKFKGHRARGHGSLNWSFSSAAKTLNYESTNDFIPAVEQDPGASVWSNGF